MNIFLKRLSQSRDQLSQLEQQVLAYILENPERVSQSNVNELAKQLFVSTATISRTCKQLGYEGFQDLKYALIKYVAQEEEAVMVPITHLSAHVQRVKKELELTLQAIDEALIEKGSTFIKESRYVEFFGVGASHPVCIDAAKKLTFSGKVSNARGDWDELRRTANSLDKRDLAILVSYSGETQHILEFAHILKAKHVKTIAVVGRKNSRLQEEVDLTFNTHIVNCYDGELDMSSRFPLSLILDFIILTYLKEVDPETKG